MKFISFKLLTVAACFAAISFLPSCKSNTNDETTNLDSTAASQLPDTNNVTEPVVGHPSTADLPTDSSASELRDTTRGSAAPR